MRRKNWAVELVVGMVKNNDPPVVVVALVTRVQVAGGVILVVA